MSMLLGCNKKYTISGVYYEITVETIRGRLEALTWCKENLPNEDYFVDLWDFNFKHPEDAMRFKLMGF